MSFEDLDDFDTYITNARLNASAWAKGLLTNPAGFVILDTETTGFDHRAEVCQIAVLRGDGEVLMNTLVRPRSPIPPDAIRIHHITNEMVASAPGFVDVFAELSACLRVYSNQVVYNAAYDYRLIAQSLESGYEPALAHFNFQCAMEQYARWYGDWNDYRGNFRWQKLSGGDHSALGDCRATLALVHKMAGVTTHVNGNSQETSL